MVDYSIVLEKYYQSWSIIDNSYDTIEFEVGDKPTQEELNILWYEMEIDLIREERKRLLAESDFRVVSDYPYREAWLEYRQKLRDFPGIWTNGMPFPQSPK